MENAKRLICVESPVRQRMTENRMSRVNTRAVRDKMSLATYLSCEVTRGYRLEEDSERYVRRRQKMYTFMKIPRELEKFMSYGFFHCLDSFLFVFTFLPIRFMLAAMAFVFRLPLSVLGSMLFSRGCSHLLYP